MSVTRWPCHDAAYLASSRHAGPSRLRETKGLAAQYRRHLSAADQHCGSEHRLGIGVDAAPPELGREKHVNLVRWLPYCGRVGDGGCLFDELDEPRVRLADDFPLPSSCATPRTVTTPVRSAVPLTTSDLAAPRATNRVSLGGCSGRHPPRRAAGKDSFGCCALASPRRPRHSTLGRSGENGHRVGAAVLPPWYATAWSRDSVTRVPGRHLAVESTRSGLTAENRLSFGGPHRPQTVSSA
jgi:hypothetical protein